MYCCSNCFADEEIKAIIRKSEMKGTCDFCASTNVYLHDVSNLPVIAELFDSLLDIYTPISFLPDNFPREHTGLIKDIFHNDWRIFNLTSDMIYKLITSLCENRYKEAPEVFDTPIGIPELQDTDFLKEHSILKGLKWSDFDIGIKTTNRFHSNFVNTDKLNSFFPFVIETYKKGKKVMYRSRICPNRKGFPPSDMSAPPNHMAKAGRANPEGIRVLYLSDSEETTLCEVRAGLYDFVSVGRFTLQKEIQVINLTKIDRISPFLQSPYGLNLTEYAINLPHLRRIALELAKPLRNANILEYLPTQYICDFIRSKGYDGVEYKSTMFDGGINLALFDPSLFKCTKTKVFDITSICYKHKILKKATSPV